MPDSSNPSSALSLPRFQTADEMVLRRYTSISLESRNPQPAHPVLFLMDNSTSTRDNGANRQLNKVQAQLSAELRQERAIAPSVLVALAAFGRSSPFELRTPFTPSNSLNLQPLIPETDTPHCQRLSLAVDFMAQAREILASQFEREVRTGWIFDFCDGVPTDAQYASKAVEASKVIAMQKNIHIFFFGIGDDCPRAYLESLAQPGRPYVHVREIESFRRFFEWLTQSLRIYSCSRPGDCVELPPFGDGPRLITEG